MNIVSLHKQDLQIVIQYLSVARITGLSEELWFFSANPTIVLPPGSTTASRQMTSHAAALLSYCVKLVLIELWLGSYRMLE